jgi:HAMP domain-containing protein
MSGDAAMPKPKSLKTILSASMVALSMVPIVGAGLLVENVLSERLRQQAGERLSSLGMQIADKLDYGMAERWQDIQVISDLYPVLEADRSAETLRTQFEALKQSMPEYAWIGLAAPDGKVLASTGRLLEGVDVSGRPWFRAGMQAPFAGDVHEAVLLAQKLAPHGNEPMRFVDIAMLLTRADGVPAGVLGAYLSWTWASDVERSVLDAATSRLPGLDTFVLDRHGTALLSPPGFQGTQLSLKTVLAGRNGDARFGIEIWPDGREWLSAVAPTRGHGVYPGLGWMVVIRQDARIAFESVLILQRQIALIGLVAAVAAFGIGRFLAYRIARPLQEIADATDRIRGGDLSARIPHTRAYAEAATLSSALVDLVVMLNRRLVDRRSGTAPNAGAPVRETD